MDTHRHHREAYYFDERQRLGYLNAVPNLIALMEMFCSADHGTVVDFGEDAGQVGPLLKENRNDALIDWGLPLIHQTVGQFVEQLLLDDALVNPWADCRAATTDVLRAFWLHPSASEAQAWADFPWEDGLGAETYRNELARSYKWSDVVKIVVRGRLDVHHRAAWHAGSMALSGPDVRLAMKMARRVVWELRQARARLSEARRLLGQPAL